jgi:hypothetical protein
MTKGRYKGASHLYWVAPARLLDKAPREELCVCDLSNLLGVSQVIYDQIEIFQIEHPA